jgi:hypothetical protein
MREKGLAPILIIVTIATLVGLIIFSNSGKLPTSSNLSKSTITPTKTPLANWNITTLDNTVKLSYRNSDYSFTIPQGWKTDYVCNGGIQEDNYICLMSEDIEQNAVPVVQKGQLIVIAPPGSSYFIANNKANPDDFCIEDTMSKYSSCKQVEYNGQKMIKRVWSNLSFVDVAIIESNKISLTLRLEYPFPVGYTDNTFDELLASIISSP